MSAAPTRRPVPDELFGGRLAGCFLLDLRVAAVTDRSARLRTITFASTDLIDFAWLPGQDVMLTIPAADPPARRRYTIRRTDARAGTLDIDVVLHGDGPFARWARAAQVGDTIEGIGPRGVIALRQDASHHLFVGDESAMAVSFAMAEALPTGTAATIVLGSDDGAPTSDPPATTTNVDLAWVPVDGIADALREVALPAGTAAYVNGERSLVRQITEQLVASGLPRDAIATKPYWRRDQANAAHGEPTKD